MRVLAILTLAVMLAGCASALLLLSEEDVPCAHSCSA